MKKIIMMLLGIVFATGALAHDTYWKFSTGDSYLKNGYGDWSVFSRLPSTPVYCLCAEDATDASDVTAQNELLNDLREGMIDIANSAVAMAETDADGKVRARNGIAFTLESDSIYSGATAYFYEVVLSFDGKFVYISDLVSATASSSEPTAFILSSEASTNRVDKTGTADFSKAGWYALAAPSLDPIEYLTWDAEAKAMVSATNTTYEVVTADTATFEDGKWYVVKDTIERGAITVNGAAHLILCDGASLTVTGDDYEPGICVNGVGGALTIYGQANGTGTLISNGGDHSAGIGGAEYSDSGATITINGGKIKATGGEGGAGIGSGTYFDSGDSRGGSDIITINGGEVEAIGGNYGAGIGCGDSGFAATITINGGKIKATGGSYGAAIGSGQWNNSPVTITINDGEIEAIGGYRGAGIGSGSYDDYAGSRSGTDTITINGGAITATGGQYGAGIGSGSAGRRATVTINGGSITASATHGDAVGSGAEVAQAATVAFAADTKFSIKAGADEPSATKMTVAAYKADHSAKYAKIGTQSTTIELDEIIAGADWTKFDVAYTLDGLEEGVDYKVLIDVTAGGVTKSITNATDIVIGSFTNSVDTVQLFGSKVFDGEAKVVLLLEADGAVVSSATEKTVELLPPPVEYLTWDEETKSLVAATNTTYEVVTAETATFEDKKWYVVTNTIERGAIKVNGEAHLILCDGATLKVMGEDCVTGVEVAEGQSLTIYGQSEGTGKLDATGGFGTAGIGGKYECTCGTITINGGTITATGGYLGAGIGGSSWSDNGATITINGGTVKATGGENGAGIGGGDYEGYTYYGGIRSSTDVDVITINGGEIEANGGQYAAGIGCGYNGFAATITINGGTIKATGGGYGAAIGSGEWNDSPVTITINDGEIEAIGGVQGAGIGAGNYYNFKGSRSGADEITINGGTITATGGQWGAGIGSGSDGLAATVTINGGTITASTVPDQGAEAIGSGVEAVSAATVTFGEGVEVSIKAGDDEASATETTVDDYVADHSAVYVEIEVMANEGLIIVSPSEGEFLGFVTALDGFAVQLQLGASDADFNNSNGFAVKVTSGKNTLYDKPDILFQKGYPTSLEINEGYKYDPENLIQTATITVKTPDGRVTTSTFTFGVLPYGGAFVHNLDEVNAAIKTAKEEEWWDLVFVKTNDFPIVSGKKIALPTLEEGSKIYFVGNGKIDVSSIVPTFGTPYDVVTNFTTNNFVEVFEEWEYDEELEKWVDVTNIYTTVEKQLAQFINTNDVAKLVFDAKRKAISLIGRGESEDYPWILDASTNVTAWVENSNLVINNGLLANSYDIDLVAMTNNFAKYKYTAPANALVKVVNGSTTNAVTSAGWVGENGTYATLGDALKAGEAKVLPGYAVSYDANGAAGVMTNSIFAVGKNSTLKANAFSAIGYDFAGWTMGTNTTVIADKATVKDLASVDGSATLTAKWNETGVSIDAFNVLTNTLVAVTNQAASLPVKITLSGEIAVPQDGVITVNASPAITFAGEAMLDVSAIVPTFGTPTVVGEGFTSTNSPALFDTKGVSKLVYEDETISLIARGESEAFPWILDASTNVTAWVESSNLVIDNGLTANSYDIDLVALTNNVATYNYTPASPLNAKVKVGEADYKTPKCWIGESDSYATLGAALEAGKTTVLPGYEVVYEANGAAGSMTNSYFAAAKEATLKANEFSAVGYDFAGWTTNGVEAVAYADAATVKDLAPVDGSATLTAQWELDEEGVTEVSFDALTNTVATAGLQKTNLPITIDFTSGVEIPTNAVLSAFPSGTGFSGIRYVPEEEGYSTLSVSNGVLYASTVREEVTVDALVLMQHAMGGSIATGKFQAYTTDEAGETIATNIVMFVGDNHKAYFNDDDNIDQMIADVLAADPRPTTVKLYEVKGAMVTFEAMGGLIEAGVDPLGNAYEGGVETITYLCLPDPGYELPAVSRADYTLIGWFDGWTNGVNEVTNKQEIVNYDEHSLYAKWQSTKIRPSDPPGEKIITTKTGEDGTIARPTDVKTLPAELILPETDTGAADGTPLTKIDAQAFAGLKTITKVALPIYVSEIGSRAFYNEKNLGEVTFVQPRDYDTLEKVPLTIGDYAFFGSKLESVTIPSTTSKLGTAAFASCANLREVTILGELTIAGDYPFRNCGSAEHPVTITLSPRAAADQAFINSLTNGCNNVVINEKYAGEISATEIRVDQPEVGKLEIDFTYSANDVDINVDTVTAVPATLNEKVVTAKDPMIPLEVRANGSNSYTAVFTKPSGAGGCFRLTVNIEK